MLGARTKQINSYGRRTQRIVTTDERRPRKEIPNIFDEPDVPIQWAPVVSRMRKRENVDKSGNSAVTTKSSSPRVVHVQRRKPLGSPLCRKKVTTTVEEASQPPRSRDKNRSEKVAKIYNRSDTDEKTPRLPLAAHPVNIPSSPAIATRRRKNIARVPTKLHKPTSNVVHVDIILLDEEGKTISKERRLSHPNAETNTPRRSVQPQPSDNGHSASDDESMTLPRRRGYKRRTAVRRIIDSDDSDSGNAPFITPSPRVSDSPTPSARIVQFRDTQSSQYRHVLKSQDTQLHTHREPLAPAVLAHPESNGRFIPLNRSTKASGHYTRIPSPIVRPRQLTPIRGNRTSRNALVPPSPSTPSDFDTSLDLSDFQLDSSMFQSPSSYHCDASILKYLKPLLEECHQEECGLYEFSAFIKSFPYDPIIQPSMTNDSMDYSFKKIGEASYSEVFGIGEVVLKIIPLRDESSHRNGGKNVNLEYDGPATSDAEDVRKEIIVTRAMGEVCTGFIKLLRAYVVRGRYPELLLRLWDEYNETRGSESIRPDTFTASQVYAIIVLPNGGPDLEAYTFTNARKTGWRQACSIFWQVSKTLAHAEQLVSFEHRDLHWGQILVKDVSENHPGAQNSAEMTSECQFMDDPAQGVQTTIIDLGLSRMDASDSNGLEKVYWTHIDQEVFMGEGDYQFDVYRLMRDHVHDDWANFKPLTNVMWLHYLVLKLLQSKRLRPPVARAAPEAKTKFTEKECYKSLLEMEALLAKNILVRQHSKKTKGKGRGKTQTPVSHQETFYCAGDIVQYGATKGWIVHIP